MLGSAIQKEIRETLQEFKNVLSRTSKTSKEVYSPRDKKSRKTYQENIIQTPYIFMASAPIFEADEVKRGESPVGGIVIGNQETGTLKSGMSYGPDLYNARGRRAYRPSAGVTSLSSEFLSSNNVSFVRHITISWSCFSLEDLEVLGERFLTLGRKIYVEWGRATKDGEIRPTLIDGDGLVDVRGITESASDEDKKAIKKLSEAARLRVKVLKVGKGNFDAAVGWVNNFGWSSREDGGFDCTTEITVQGVNALDGPTNVSTSHKNDGKKKPIKKFIENESDVASEYSFNQALQELPQTILGIMKADDLYKGYTVFENKTSADAFVPEVQNTPYEGASMLYWQAQVGADTLNTAMQEYYQEQGLFGIGPGGQGLLGLKIQAWLSDKFFGSVDEQSGEELDRLATAKKALDEGYTAPAYYENAKNEAQWIGTDSNKNFILTQTSGIKDDKTTTEDIKNYDRGDTSSLNLQSYFKEVASKNKGMKNLKMGTSQYEIFEPEKTWVRWGWFEDNMLNRFFALLDKEGKKVSWIRSTVATGELRTEYTNVPHTDNPELTLEENLETSMKVETIDDYESIDVSSHPHFRTTDINKFIFPGKFDIEKGYIDENGAIISMEAANAQRLSGLKESLTEKKAKWKEKKDKGEGYKGDYTDINEEHDGDAERLLASEIRSLESQISETYKNIKLAKTLNEGNEDDIKEKISEWPSGNDVTTGLAATNTDTVEEGYEPYLFLKSLDERVKEMRTFTPDFDGKKGKLRNILINVKHLQDVFSNQSATLGENMNALFESLARESGGLIDLVMAADNRDNIGCIQAQERKFGEADKEKIEKFKNNPELMYEFPVMQNDSFVSSQELASDISGENYKILLSKSYDERIQAEKKKGISLIHQAQLSVVTGKSQDSDSNYDFVADLKPAFLLDGYSNYGQAEGDEDIPLGPNGSPFYNQDETLNSSRSAQEKSNREAQLEQDLLTRDNVFSETNIAYTATGKLKGFLDKNMREEIKWKKVEAETDEGIKYKVTLPNVDDYGMVGLTNTLTMKGIAGIIPSNLFTTSYLPRKFKEHSHFYATDVGQTIDSSGWKTTITGRMVWKYIPDIDEPLASVFKLKLNTDFQKPFNINDYKKKNLIDDFEIKVNTRQI